MSHHSSGYDDEIRKNAIKEFIDDNIGPTGEFPLGKLTKSDEGGIAFAVYKKDGKVVMDFNSPVHWLGMTAKEAIELANLLIKNGREILEL